MSGIENRRSSRVDLFGLFKIFIYRYFKGGKREDCSACAHDHSELHRDQDKSSKASRGNYLTSGLLGIATGMIPCPTIVVSYLSGISKGDSLEGVNSVVLFALGMFLSLLGVVIFFSFGGEKIFKRFRGSKFLSKWELVQGCAFILIGIVTTFYH